MIAQVVSKELDRILQKIPLEYKVMLEEKDTTTACPICSETIYFDSFYDAKCQAGHTWSIEN